MMLEWYRIGGTLEDLIRETEKLIADIASGLLGTASLPRRPWPVFSVRELFNSILDIDLEKMSDVQIFRDSASHRCTSVVPTDSWDDVFCKLFMEFVEPILAQKEACFVAYYPQQMGALAAKNTKLNGVVDRFEAYIGGVEICNGYRELIDYEDFLKRVSLVEIERNDISRDPLFEAAMRSGLYPCVGNALGLDRLIAVLRGERDLQSILPWPFASRFPNSTIALE
jgi:lysyl-tRNA synthetase class 2